MLRVLVKGIPASTKCSHSMIHLSGSVASPPSCPPMAVKVKSKSNVAAGKFTLKS
jgi:hypothetical protein